MAESVPSRRALPVLDVAAGKGRWLGVGGILACSLCCLSIPGVATALGAVGLGFLRNDRILFPAAVAFAAVVGWAFHRSWRRHRRAGPGLSALTGTVGILTGFRMPSPLGSWLITLGAALLVAATAWDWRVTRRCGAPPLRG